MSKKWTIASMLLLLFVVSGTLMTALAYLRNDSTQQSAPSTTSQSEASTKVQSPLESAPKSDSVTVIYTDRGFSPASLTVTKGTTIVFDNQTEIPMWVASDPHPEHTDYPDFDVMRNNGGQYPEPRNDFNFTFDNLGNWTYHNHAMPDHTAKITVTN